MTTCRLTPEENVKLQIRRMKQQAMKIAGYEVPEENMEVRLEFPKKDCPTEGKPRLSLFGCEAGMTAFCVSLDGKLLGCQMLGAFQVDIPDLQLEKAWDAFPFSVHFDIEENKCAHCEYEAFCQSCPASRIAETGSIYAGPGYAQVHFSSDGRSCKQTYSTSIILHHVLPENEGAAYQEATNAISGATGNNPNLFKGIETFRDIPGRDWSY